MVAYSNISESSNNFNKLYENTFANTQENDQIGLKNVILKKLRYKTRELTLGLWPKFLI